MSSSPSDPPPVVVEDCAGLLRVYSDGSVVRSPEPAILVPVLDDGSVGWKDVLFSPGHDLRLRLYRPRPRAAAGGSGPPAPPRKLPVVFYFRGGGFCVGSRAWPNFHNYCLRLASELGAVVVSPDYRLAPEHRLPAALDDALAALLWLRSQAAAGEGGADPWLAEAADFGRVFVCGDSSGGNLAHHLAVRFASAPGRSGLAPVRIRGFVLLMPFFGGTAPARSEAECPPDAFLSREVCDQFWRLSIPAGATLDHPLVNPFGPESPDLEPAEFDPTVVVVGGRDLLRDRAVEYANRLGELGKPVELVEFEGAEHGFFTFQPRSEPDNRLMGVLKRFVDSNGDSCRSHG